MELNSLQVAVWCGLGRESKYIVEVGCLEETAAARDLPNPREAPVIIAVYVDMICGVGRLILGV